MNISENAGSSWITPTTAAFSSRAICDRCYSLRLSGKTCFTEESVRSKYCNDGFFSLLRDDGELDLAFPDIEDRIRRFSLGKDDLAFAVLGNAVAVPDTSEKRFWVE